MLTWNGVPLLLQDVHGQLDQWLRQFQKIDEVCQFCGVEPARVASINAPQSIAGCGITSPNWPELPPLRINELIMPTGAARFGYFVGLAPLSDASRIGEPGSSGVLKIGEGDGALNVSMYVLAFRPITCIPGNGQLGLLVLVDRRYGWQSYDAGNILVQNSFPMLQTSGDLSGTPNNDYGQYQIGYSEVFLALEQRMGVQFNRDSAPGVLDVLELSNRKFFNAAVLLDALAESAGMRVWVDWEGNVQIHRSTTGYQSNFNNTENLIAGGLYDAPPLPAAVQVNFPRARYYHSYGDGDRYTIRLNTQGGLGGSAAITVDSCCYAHWLADPDNYQNAPVNLSTLRNIATNIQADLIGWWKQGYDATFLGVKRWKQTGFDNYVAISYGRTVPNDVYKLPVDSDRVPKADNKFDLNYRVYTTRAQSLPTNFGARVNYQQDGTIRFLRGVQWGKLSEDSQPPKTNDSGQKYPQPTKVTIWQLNASLKEQSTKIEIQAYDSAGGDSVLPKDTRVLLQWHEVNRCWMYQQITAGKNQPVAIYSSSTAVMIGPTPFCLFPGKKVTTDTSNSPCGSGFFSYGDDCWIVPTNNDGEPVRAMVNRDIYLGEMIGTYSQGTDPSYPVYAIRAERRLVRFQLLARLRVGQSPATFNAIELQWNDLLGQYIPVGSPISVVDPFQQTGGEFSGYGTDGPNAGYRGWAEWKPDREIYEIVWMEQTARLIKFQVRSGDKITTATESIYATVISYAQGRDPGQNVNVYNLLVSGGASLKKYLFAAPELAYGIALFDDRASQYVIITVQTKPLFVQGVLTSALGSDGQATGKVTAYWGPTTPAFNSFKNTVTLRDQSTPPIFTGSSGDQFQATYDAEKDAYNFTWVQCSTGATGA